jgi:tRNA (guanine-N7-)-methyltransferase
MGHDKLRKFAENETFSCLLQPSAQELLADGYFHLRDHAVKGCWAQRFGNGRPLVLELGCGKGEYTIALAERDPERNFIGVDIKGARLWKGAKYATEHRLPNVAFLRTRVEFITAFFAPGEVSEVWLTFSDPQYRSENSRLCSPLFLERYRSFLVPGGVVHLKTDSRFLHEYALAVCRANGLRILACTSDLYGTSDEASLHGSQARRTSGCAGPLPPTESAGPSLLRSRGWLRSGEPAAAAASPSVIPSEVTAVQTFYEQLFLQQGYPITYLSFVIDHDGPYVSPRDPEDFDSKAWRAAEGPRLLFGHDSAETRRQKLKNR